MCMYIYTYISRARGRAEPGDRIARVGAYVSAGQGPQPPIYARSRARAGLPRLSTRIDFYARIRAYIFIYIYIYIYIHASRAHVRAYLRNEGTTVRRAGRASASPRHARQTYAAWVAGRDRWGVRARGHARRRLLRRPGHSPARAISPAGQRSARERCHQGVFPKCCGRLSCPERRNLHVKLRHCAPT